MTITTGQAVPNATLSQMGANGPEDVALIDRLKGRKVVIFGLPGAYTGTCSTAHLPSFIRTKAALAAKGVDEVICVAANDAYVMKAWGDVTGATVGGVTMLGDPASEFTKAIGMAYSAPTKGLFDRSKRYSMYVVDGVVQVLNLEDNTGMCEISAGETLLGQI